MIQRNVGYLVGINVKFSKWYWNVYNSKVIKGSFNFKMSSSTLIQIPCHNLLAKEIALKFKK